MFRYKCAEDRDIAMTAVALGTGLLTLGGCITAEYCLFAHKVWTWPASTPTTDNSGYEVGLLLLSAVVLAALTAGTFVVTFGLLIACGAFTAWLGDCIEYIQDCRREWHDRRIEMIEKEVWANKVTSAWLKKV